MIPSRGLLIVKPIESAERLPGSLILLTTDTRERMTAHQAEVVAVGAFAACEDEECTRPHVHDTALPLEENVVHPHRIAVGDWILHAPRASIGGPDPEKPERFVHQDAVWMVFGEDDADSGI